MLLGSLSDKAGHLFLGCLKLLGYCCIVAGHLFLGCLKLLGDRCIVADHLFLRCFKLFDAGLELPDVLLHDGKETAQQLGQLFRLRRRAGDGWRGAYQKRLGRRYRLQRCRL